jgi:hypothetical protein
MYPRGITTVYAYQIFRAHAGALKRTHETTTTLAYMPLLVRCCICGVVGVSLHEVPHCINPSLQFISDMLHSHVLMSLLVHTSELSRCSRRLVQHCTFSLHTLCGMAHEGRNWEICEGAVTHHRGRPAIHYTSGVLMYA